MSKDMMVRSVTLRIGLNECLSVCLSPVDLSMVNPVSRPVSAGITSWPPTPALYRTRSMATGLLDHYIHTHMYSIFVDC